MTVSPAAALDISGLSAGLLIARLVLGVGMAAHGAQKLFGWFGGSGLSRTGGFFEGLGFRPGRLFAAADGLAESVSGLLVAVGLLGPVGPALMISPMVVAIVTVHCGNGFFATGNGIELPLLYAAGALALAFTGFGAFSLDSVLGVAGLTSPALAAVAVTIGVVGAAAMLALRKPVAKPGDAHG